jgi:anhydro-N-acetylmuramic acid kinase
MRLNFIENKSKHAIGLLSGTSVDGIDVVLIQIQGSQTQTKLKVLDFITFPYPAKIQEAILKNSEIKTAKIDEICRLNVIIGQLFGEAALRICKKNRIKPNAVAFIGSHGQTIHHLPDNKSYGGFRTKSSLQIGDPSVIANISGITTVGDFRIADCAVGGDGAPLVPYFDYILFRHRKLNRGLLNIGGIANITVIPKNSGKNEVIAFDTGPGNMLIDELMKRLFNKSYDEDGLVAQKGKMNNDLFEYFKKDVYYKKRPPKSTGREHYGSAFVSNIMKHSVHIKKVDIIRTITEFTAYSIWYNYKKFIQDKIKIDELIVSGGGSKNKTIYKLLSSYFKGVKIRDIKLNGANADNKEAVLFAVLANECLAGNPSNIPKVTGSTKDVILGKICPVKSYKNGTSGTKR